ncbi:flagellar biosynthesis anti-sigma factor FlgM [Tatumella sp. TA1]|uniref:flagellar biosynthesis anti-sigma factor FlgM n=1 Tax=Rosenbergiella collisarenosi TaxID=1544695 RepID=UPI0008F881A5|nr:flagellar biosynthesis anti-sigma factor FlgM [Rosenbergiella collisarenosi]MBT0721148.1 flagellar biosynthesis anti-sigma factor FlgM [Rosenbergiella collisarenosi]QGX91174.1 flagellar biosynthesis anti-sigma factor FlgM [Tatumella sp. TA1]
MTIEKIPGIAGRANDALQDPRQTRAFNAEQPCAQLSPHAQPPASVGLSHSLAQFTQLNHTDIDTEKVQQLRQSMAEGRYQIDAGKIADGLIAELKE